jgi:lipopolysaccharide/colanic/teichoic acid biosynthesis glycosyltransferase
MKNFLCIFFEKTIVSITIIFLSPLIILISLLIFIQDFKNPFYFGKRVGLNGKLFNQIKFRSMTHYNQRTPKIESTSNNDSRITKIGKFIRKYKIDEIPQFFNIIKGDMSLIGPRPNTISETNKYFEIEKLLLTVKPGISDFSSIVFSDEGKILSNSLNPDEDYNYYIRFWKSYLGLIYIKEKRILHDIYLCWLTILSFVSRDEALKKINKVILSYSPNYSFLSEIILRKNTLKKRKIKNSDFIFY